MHEALIVGLIVALIVVTERNFGGAVNHPAHRHKYPSPGGACAGDLHRPAGQPRWR